MTPIESCLADRGPPLPWIAELAAEIEGESVGAFRADAGARARSLATTADLFDLPAVPVSFDPTLEAEAVGCEVEEAVDGADDPAVRGVVSSVEGALAVDVDAVTTGGRIPAVLDATERLASTLDSTSVLGGITGPGRLTDSLLVEDASDDPDVVEEAAFLAEDLAIELANAYLDRDVDGLVVLEPGTIGDPDRFREAVMPLLNVVEHFDATAILARRSVGDAAVELAAEAGFDAITGRIDDPGATLEIADEAGIVLGVGVPRERFVKGTVDEFLVDLPSDALVSSEWAVPSGTDVDALHDLMGTRD